MVLVAVRDQPYERRGPLFVGCAARAVVLAGAGMKDHALLRNRQAFGVEGGEPGGRGGGRRGEVDHDAVLVQEGDDAVEPAEVVLAGAGFDLRPGEDPERDEV